MLDSFAKSLLFLRARWRWTRGRCPRCNRDLYTACLYHLAGDPNCPVCKDETATDLRIWHKYTASGTTRPKRQFHQNDSLYRALATTTKLDPKDALSEGTKPSPPMFW